MSIARRFTRLAAVCIVVVVGSVVGQVDNRLVGKWCQEYTVPCYEFREDGTFTRTEADGFDFSGRWVAKGNIITMPDPQVGIVVSPYRFNNTGKMVEIFTVKFNRVASDAEKAAARKAEEAERAKREAREEAERAEIEARAAAERAKWEAERPEREAREAAERAKWEAERPKREAEKKAGEYARSYEAIRNVVYKNIDMAGLDNAYKELLKKNRGKERLDGSISFWFYINTDGSRSELEERWDIRRIHILKDYFKNYETMWNFNFGKGACTSVFIHFDFKLLDNKGTRGTVVFDYRVENSTRCVR